MQPGSMPLQPSLQNLQRRPETTQPTGTMNPLQKLEARVIRSHQAADVLQYLKLQTPNCINIPLLTELLANHPDRVLVSNLSTGLSHGLRVGYKGGHFPQTAKNLPSAKQHPSTENLLRNWSPGRPLRITSF